MALVTVIAIKPFAHQGRSFHLGEAVTVEALEAAILAQAGRVTLDRAARPTYQTRALEPEPPVSPVIVVPPSPSASVVPTRRRRRSRGRQAALSA